MLDLFIVKSKILTTFQAKIAPSRLFTNLFFQFDLMTYFFIRLDPCSNMKTNILINFNHAQVEHVAFRVLKIFPFKLIKKSSC